MKSPETMLFYVPEFISSALNKQISFQIWSQRLTINEPDILDKRII